MGTTARILVQAGEVGGVGEQYSDLDDVVQAGAACLEYGLAIRQRLSCLIAEPARRCPAAATRSAPRVLPRHRASGPRQVLAGM